MTCNSEANKVLAYDVFVFFNRYAIVNIRTPDPNPPCIPQKLHIYPPEYMCNNNSVVVEPTQN